MNEKNFAIGLAKKVGVLIKDNFILGMKKEWKKDDTPVTVTDLVINQIVIDEVHKHYPDYGIIAEEGSDYSGQEYIWVCDPIDGTIPFSQGIPVCTFMLALVKNGKSILGVIHDPFMNRLYFAEKDKGAYLNGEKIQVSKSTELKQTAVGMITWTKAKYRYWGLLEDLLEEGVFDCRIPAGGYMDGLVASGEFSVLVSPVHSPWDSAAPKIIVEEAGGKCTDLFGNEFNFTGETKGHLATNGLLHQKLLDMIKKNLS